MAEAQELDWLLEKCGFDEIGIDCLIAQRQAGYRMTESHLQRVRFAEPNPQTGNSFHTWNCH